MLSFTEILEIVFLQVNKTSNGLFFFFFFLTKTTPVSTRLKNTNFNAPHRILFERAFSLGLQVKLFTLKMQIPLYSQMHTHNMEQWANSIASDALVEVS